MVKKRSKIWLITKEKLQELLDNSSNFREVLSFFELDTRSGNHATLYRRVKDDLLDLTKLNQNRKLWKSNSQKGKCKNTIPENILFAPNSSHCGSVLKKRIIKDKLIPYICSECNLDPIWNGKPLTLDLDHINGINNDNIIKNLRFLCPNCHSQTQTFKGKSEKRRKREIFNCKSCGTELKSNGLTGLCVSCCRKQRINVGKTIKLPDLETLIELKKVNSFSTIGNLYGMSGTAFRKWYITNTDIKKQL